MLETDNGGQTSDQAATDRDKAAERRDQAAELRDRGAEDRDVRARQHEHLASDQDQTWSDRDQAASGSDQRSADRDQQAADDDVAAGGNTLVHDSGVLARRQSGRDREVASVSRHETADARLREHDEDAREDEIRLLGERDRARAANDREDAAVDREEAASERAEALLDRTESAVAEQRAVETLESMSDAFFTLDSEWRFTYLNPQTEVILGRRREDLVGKDLWEAFPEAVGSRFDEEFRRASREGVPVRFEEVYEPRGRTLDVRAYPVPDGLAIYFCDVTTERSHEERLRQAQRLEAIGRVTAGVAHDFNNLLAAICGFAELGQAASLDEKARYFDEIGSAGQRAMELTRQLLTFAREQALAPTVVDLNDVVDGLSSLLRQFVPAGVKLRFALSPHAVPVFVDRSQLEQVLINLVVNSRDAIDTTGSITLSTTTDAPIDDTQDVHGPSGWLQVADSGCGIPPDVMPHIFDPFFSTKPPEIGTGLGLATIYGTISQSGGSIFVESKVDVGTTMTVVLPAEH